MTWSYGGDPAGSDVDEIRFLIGDTDSSRQLMQDEEIQYWLSQLETVYDSPLEVAAFCCDTLAVKFAKEVAQSGDGVNVAAEQLQQKMEEAADRLRTQRGMLQGAGAGPYIGSNDAETSANELQGWAKIGQHDNPRAGSQDLSDLGWWDGRPENAL